MDFETKEKKYLELLGRGRWGQMRMLNTEFFVEVQKHDQL